jgi:putative NADPH-quinone reductase
MNAVILNGGPDNERGAACRAIRDAAAAEFRSSGWFVRTFELEGMTIKPCVGCFACWLKHPGTCAIRDDAEEYVKAFVASDAVVWISPVTFGGMSSALKKALDRTIPSILPFFVKTRGEIHHPQRYEKRRRLLAFGTLPAPDAEAESIFRNLIQRNAINLAALETETGFVYETGSPQALAARVGDLARAAGIDGRRPA